MGHQTFENILQDEKRLLNKYSKIKIFDIYLAYKKWDTGSKPVECIFYLSVSLKDMRLK